MDWIKKYDAFLFDFDGLLVNTEEMHYNAYKKMMLDRNVPLTWDFNRYCSAAHYDATAFRDQITEEYPELFNAEPNWDIMYKEKQKAVLDQVEAGQTELMPGVEKLLLALQAADKPRAVVTHSPLKLIEMIKSQNPVLQTIPLWITREQYSKPKPDPECYHYAISLMNKPGYKFIGFEDTPRGITALSQTEAQAVIICKANYPELPLFIEKGIKHFTSFETIHDV